MFSRVLNILLALVNVKLLWESLCDFLYDLVTFFPVRIFPYPVQRREKWIEKPLHIRIYTVLNDQKLMIFS